MSDKKGRKNTQGGVLKALKIVYQHSNMSDSEFTQFVKDIRQFFADESIEIPKREE